MKIVLCGLTSDKNVGEHLVSDSCRWLYDKIIKEDNEFDYLDFYARTPRDMSKYGKMSYERLMTVFKISDISKKIDQYIPVVSGFVDCCNWYIDKATRKKCVKYYKDKIEKADLVIFAGGGVIEATSVHRYCFPIYEIVKLAEKYNIPVIFNAVGLVKKPRNFDLRSIYMKKALNSATVKMISVRDGLVEMNRCYLKNHKKAHKVADTAVWSSQVYNVKRDKFSDTIGLGLIRGDCYIDYNVNFDEEALINLWCEIIYELECKNYKWKIFVNGLDSDHKIAIKILHRLNIENINEYICPQTSNGEKFIKTLASFKAIIVHRLHSCIAAYSLDIPAIALSWNKKLEYFMNEIGYPERAVPVEKYDSKYIVEVLERAMSDGYREKKKYKYSVVRAAKKALDKIGE